MINLSSLTFNSILQHLHVLLHLGLLSTFHLPKQKPCLRLCNMSSLADHPLATTMYQ